MRRLAKHRRFLLIRYEDLVRDPDRIQALLAARMRFLRPTARFSEFHHIASPSAKSLAALGGLRSIDTAGIGRWRRHLPRIAGQLVIHGPITRDLIEFGYEADDRWLHLLDGVEPDLTPSFWPETIKRPVWKLRRIAYGEAVRIAAARLTGDRLV
jgi:hypothetical protein